MVCCSVLAEIYAVGDRVVKPGDAEDRVLSAGDTEAGVSTPRAIKSPDPGDLVLQFLPYETFYELHFLVGINQLHTLRDKQFEE